MKLLPFAALALSLFALGCRADAAPGDEEADLTMSGFEQLSGTSVLVAALGDAPSGSRSSRASGYSEWSGGTHNVLFFDTEADEGRWLFPNNAPLILGRDDLLASGDSSVQALVFRVVTKDTNEDEELTPADDYALVAVNPDGSGRRAIARDVESDMGRFEVSPEAVVFTYQSAGQPHAVELTLADLSSREIALPPVPGSEL